MAPQSYELSSVLTFAIILIGFLFSLLFLKLLVVSLQLLYRIIRCVLWDQKQGSQKTKVVFDNKQVEKSNEIEKPSEAVIKNTATDNNRPRNKNKTKKR